MVRFRKQLNRGLFMEKRFTQGNWEFIFAQPRQAGQLPVIKHAQFNGWH